MRVALRKVIRRVLVCEQGRRLGWFLQGDRSRRDARYRSQREEGLRAGRKGSSEEQEMSGRTGSLCRAPQQPAKRSRNPILSGVLELGGESGLKEVVVGRGCLSSGL